MTKDKISKKKLKVVSKYDTMQKNHLYHLCQGYKNKKREEGVENENKV